MSGGYVAAALCFLFIAAFGVVVRRAIYQHFEHDFMRWGPFGREAFTPEGARQATWLIIAGAFFLGVGLGIAAFVD
ncbi:MAG: hypothetical protein WEB00_03070 [Dehalococcoidia bacterium]